MQKFSTGLNVSYADRDMPVSGTSHVLDNICGKEGGIFEKLSLFRNGCSRGTPKRHEARTPE